MGHKLVAGEYQAFVDKLHAQLPFPILRQTVHDSIKSLLKKELTEARLVATAWRMAANLSRLSEQQPVPEWNGQQFFEWVPMQVCGVQQVRQYGKLAYLFTFQSLGGTIVPLRMTQTWSPKKTSYLAVYRNVQGNGFGFGRSRINGRGEQQGRGLYRNVQQFYGLRCFLLLDPKRSQKEPFAIEIGHTGATMAHNKQLITERDRKQTPCRQGLVHQPECYACPYGLDRCALATHEATYRQGTCPRCAQFGFFDPLETEHPELCLACVYIERKT